MSRQVESGDLLAAFIGALGIGALFLLPLRYALLTLAFAIAVVAWKVNAISRLIGFGVAAVVLGGAVLVWAFDSSAQNQEVAVSKMRLAIVHEINYLREQRHLEPLQFDPGMSIFAQQQADYAAAAHTGTATEPTAGKSPAAETNTWAEMAGISCSVRRLFEVSHLIKEKRKIARHHVELGFIYNVPPGTHTLPVLAPVFNSIGVGFTHLPSGAISLQIDVTGHFRPRVPWSHLVPNLIGQVIEPGGAPECG